jgi:hypothetical protein
MVPNGTVPMVPMVPKFKRPAREEAHKGHTTARIGQLSEDEESGLLDTYGPYALGGTVEIPRVSATQSLKSCCVTAFTAS